MTDQQIIEALIARDERVTQQFFFGNCRPLFLSIIRNVFSYEVDYDEFVNEFYLHLMENDAYRLRQFQGRSTIYQWMKVIAIRYFIAKRDSMIDNESKDALLDSVVQNETVDGEKKMTAKMDIEHLFSLMPNRRSISIFAVSFFSPSTVSFCTTLSKRVSLESLSIILSRFAMK